MGLITPSHAIALRHPSSKRLTASTFYRATLLSERGDSVVLDVQERKLNLIRAIRWNLKRRIVNQRLTIIQQRTP